SLPAGVIEERFQIGPTGGCAALFLGDWPKGLQGGGFIYTNRDSLSVGFVAQLPALERQGVSILEALDAFKRRPAVRRLIQGGERLEYGAHVVPEGGWHMRPRLAGAGVMLVGDAAGLVLAAGVIYEGVHYAMHSGVLAAETALEALEAGDFSARFLGRYARRLKASYVGRNLRAFRHMPQLLTNPRMYTLYPHAVAQMAQGFFRAEATGHVRLGALLWRHLLRPAGWRALLTDAWRLVRALV
ncbi:MAG: FAD-dependent oxidoreductase, partial [Deltaproteobacteria bacterium]|nr:FAD-dependent oxidoreductase [Deltaproteobacteria bacterium]